MKCPECGRPMEGIYDGGEANDYRLCIPSCSFCGYVHWEALEEDDDEEDDA